MGQKKYAKSPLLYIHQPTVRTPEAPMQHNYRTPKRSANDGLGAGEVPSGDGGAGAPGSSSAVPKKRAPARRPLQRENFSKPVEKEKSEDTTEDNERDKPSDTHGNTDEDERKKFKDLTLRERVEYFLNTPEHVPTMRCEVRTEERKYRGKVVDFQEEQVFMRIGRRKSAIKIPFDEIFEIGLIGF